MRIAVDTDKCCGAGQCVLASPSVFDQDDTGTVILLTDEPAAGDIDSARTAATLCPAAAITIID